MAVISRIEIKTHYFLSLRIVQRQILSKIKMDVL